MPIESPRLVFLGGGAVIKELHLPALERLGWTDRALFVEASERSCQALREGRPGLHLHQGDYRTFLEDPTLKERFDGAVVALPNHLHEDAVRRALRAGLHVMCEKPLALDAAACLRLAAEAEKADRRLAVAMVRRLIPSVTAIRNALAAGLIGELEEISIHHGGAFHWPSDSGAYFRKENGGLLVNMGVHYLDMIESWGGELIPEACWNDEGGGVEANVDYRLRTAGGASVRLCLSVTHELENRIRIQGTRGVLTAGVDEFDRCSWRADDAALAAVLRPERPFRSGAWPLDFTSAFVEQFAEFAWAIAGKEPPRVDARQAARTLEIIEWALAHRRPLPHAQSCSEGRPLLAPGAAVVTGGSGFLGGHLVGRLAELGFSDLRVPIRSFRSGANVARFPVDRRLTNLLDRQSVREIVRGARYVFHLAYGSSGPDAGNVTVEGTKNVVEAAIEEEVEALVVTSTCSVFGHSGGPRTIDENSPYQPSLGEYGQSKAAAERYCLARAKTSGKTRIVVLNPSAVYGPGGSLFTELPSRAARKGAFCWIEGGRGILNYVFVANLVDALLLAASCSKAHGQRFIISDGHCTMREFLTPILGRLGAELPSFSKAELLALETGKKAGLRDLLRALTSDQVMEVVNRLPLLAVPKRFVERRLGGLYRKLQKRRLGLKVIQSAVALDTPRHNPPSWLADIFGPQEVVYSAANARQVLGWSPQVSLSEGQAICVSWLQFLGLWEDEAKQPADGTAPVNGLTAAAIKV